MDVKEFYEEWKKIDIEELAQRAIIEFTKEYHASQMPSDYRYCPYCGEELRGEIETVVGSPLVCKNTMCKQSLTKRR